MACKLCQTRRPRRFCPGVSGDICAICCGTNREETVSCPFDCVYLREARTREKPPAIDPKQIPNLDIEVSDSFLHKNEALFAFLAVETLQACLATEGVVDYDVREALDAMVRTWRTRESGLYYETKPASLVAAAIQRHLEPKIEEFRRSAVERYGLTTIRDADILGMLAFLQRLEYQLNNGRKRGRAFLEFLLGQAGAFAREAQPSPVAPNLIQP
jgi:hypothetical protein